MLVERLAKLASVGAALREKRAGLGTFAAKTLYATGKQVAKPIASLAMKRPLETAIGGAIAVGGVKKAISNTKKYQAGFDPNVQRAMLGQPSTPPGSQ